MHSLFMLFPGFILSLSLFHYSVVVHRFQMVFDSLTPSVIQRYVSTSIQESLVYFWLDPQYVMDGIQSYFQNQFPEVHTQYSLEFVFFQDDQISHCDWQCYGVLTILTTQITYQTISFSRHYQLVRR